MAQIFQNNAQGVGASGTVPSTGNTGNNGNTAFNTVTVGTTGAITVDNTVPSLGPFAFKFACGATADANQLVWTSATMTESPQTIWFRFLLNLPALTSVTQLNCFEFQSTATQVIACTVQTSGTVRITNSAAATITTSTMTLATNKTYRIEGFAFSSATVGQSSVSIYDDPTSLVAKETNLSAASQNTQGGAINKAFCGIIGTQTSFTSFISDFAVSNIGPIGPRMVQAAAAA